MAVHIRAAIELPDGMSLQELEEELRQKARALYPDDVNSWTWVESTMDGVLVIEHNGDHFQHEWSLEGTEATIAAEGQRVEKKVSYEAVAASEAARFSCEGILRAGKTPKEVEVDILGSGLSHIQRDRLPGVIPEEGVDSAITAFAGAKVYAFRASDTVEGKPFFDHLTGEPRKWLMAENEVGYLHGGRKEADGGRYVARFSLIPRPDLPESITSLIRAGVEQQAVGLSVDAGCQTRQGSYEGKPCIEFYAFGPHPSGPPSVDVVSRPAAHGRFRRLVASITAQESEETDQMTETTKDQDKIRASTAEVEKEAEAARAEMQRLKDELAQERWKLSRDAKLDASKLPTFIVDQGKALFSEKVEDEVLGKWVEKMRAGLAETDSKVTGQGADVQVLSTPRDKIELGLEGLLVGRENSEYQKRYADLNHGGKLLAAREAEAGIRRPTSFRDFFETVHGHDIRFLVQDQHRRSPQANRIRASITTSDWSDVFENVLNVMGRAYFEDPNFGAWRAVTRIGPPLTNIHKQERVVTGGYANLSTVAENGSYTKFTSPGDQGHGFTPAKYGNTDDWTREAVLQDNIAALGDMVRKMGIAAARTLYEYVFDQVTIAGQPTMDYDSVALFNSTSHSNKGSTALSAAQLAVRWLAMRKQADLTNSKRLGIDPKFLLIPVDLQKTARDILRAKVEEPSGATTESSFIRDMNLTTIVVRHWTNTTDWFLMADPNTASIPVYEMSFEPGAENPMFTVQDAGVRAGSWFDRDAITVKCAHGYYGGSPLRHEAFDGSDV